MIKVCLALQIFPSIWSRLATRTHRTVGTGHSKPGTRLICQLSISGSRSRKYSQTSTPLWKTIMTTELVRLRGGRCESACSKILVRNLKAPTFYSSISAVTQPQSQRTCITRPGRRNPRIPQAIRTQEPTLRARPPTQRLLHRPASKRGPNLLHALDPAKLAAMERTEMQWRKLLDEDGLEVTGL